MGAEGALRTSLDPDPPAGSDCDGFLCGPGKSSDCNGINRLINGWGSPRTPANSIN